MFTYICSLDAECFLLVQYLRYVANLPHVIWYHQVARCCRTPVCSSLLPACTQSGLKSTALVYANELLQLFNQIPYVFGDERKEYTASISSRILPVQQANLGNSRHSHNRICRTRSPGPKLNCKSSSDRAYTEL